MTNIGENASSPAARSVPTRPAYGLANQRSPIIATPASAGRSRTSRSVSPKIRNRYEVAASERSPRHVWGTSPPATRVVSKRSEEHTSELQSRQYLVCRLLLEK